MSRNEKIRIEPRPMDSLSRLRTQYLERTTAPLDGMWLTGFVPLARHFGLIEDDEVIGFFCLNEDGHLLQFFVAETHQQKSSRLFETLVHEGHVTSGEISGAFVSTAEPLFLSLCLDQFAEFEVHSLMYRRAGAAEPVAGAALELLPVEQEQLSVAVEFAVTAIAAPEGWVTGYYENLISRGELFGVWKDGDLIATGESRRNDESQKSYVDLGVVVAKAARGRGLATRVLGQLDTMNQAQGLQSICSTEKGNLGAQKAISRAGFVSDHRILRFSK